MAARAGATRAVITAVLGEVRGAAVATAIEAAGSTVGMFATTAAGASGSMAGAVARAAVTTVGVATGSEASGASTPKASVAEVPPSSALIGAALLWMAVIKRCTSSAERLRAAMEVRISESRCQQNAQRVIETLPSMFPLTFGATDGKVAATGQYPWQKMGWDDTRGA